MRYFKVDVREEPTEYGFMPTMQMYLLEGAEKKRPVVLIVPGGGYTTVCIQCDGEKTAMQYNAAGFHAAVLRYSVEPHHFPEPQRDLMSAIRILRENGGLWGIHEDRIAIIGFSAGGHLCASVSTLWHLAKRDAALYKPNAAILCYAILTARLNHCRDFLEDHVGRDERKLKLAACEEQVSGYTPPTFLYGTFEDTLTNPENVLYYAEKLCDTVCPLSAISFQGAATARHGATIPSGPSPREKGTAITSACRWNGCGNYLDCCRCPGEHRCDGRNREHRCDAAESEGTENKI